MRHSFSMSIAQLPSGMRAASSSALLVQLPGGSLARPPTASRTLGSAVPSPRDVAQRAKQHGPSTARILTDDNAKRDHGPPPTPITSTSAWTRATNTTSTRALHGPAVR